MTNLHLEATLASIAKSVQDSKKLKLADQSVYFYGKDEIVIRLPDDDDGRKRKTKSKTASKPSVEPHLAMDILGNLLPQVMIAGYPDAHRAVIARDDKDESIHRILVEGYGLRQCMNTVGVDFSRTRTNSVIETFKVLGIEAARRVIIDEISQVMRTMDIDPRHMQLLADVMTYKGEVLGITRFGLAKMRDSILQLASFEKTPDHLFEAAWNVKSDKIQGVSECIIMGQEMGIGTGLPQVVRDMGFEEGDIGRRETVFEDCWRELKGEVQAW